MFYKKLFINSFTLSLWGALNNRAEIIPFEPETGNAGAGKLTAFIINLIYEKGVLVKYNL